MAQGPDHPHDDLPTGEWEYDRVPIRFHLKRHDDESGVSGEGIVAEGVVFSDGRTVLMWYNDENPNVSTEGNGLAIYDSFDDAVQIHGHGGASEFKFVRDDMDPTDFGASEATDTTVRDVCLGEAYICPMCGSETRLGDAKSLGTSGEVTIHHDCCGERTTHTAAEYDEEVFHSP